ncbi:eosinophil granule major basic protein 1-like [Neopelma chrysocephalum]|uniref:eosinophil granule major basic protein 1-like n=1 Tax=Neopelma chrysocephalum TaxID=114329 RepID=UPI000FCD06EC|nr:eosinophil granule major basic protein 1-like [Neopelma chrysocephalum]
MTLLVPLGPASPMAEETEEVTGLEVLEEAVGASDTQTLSVPSAPGASTPTYIMVPWLRTFQEAQVGWSGLGGGSGWGALVPPVTATSLQSFCSWRYRGKLASVHSARTNAFLLRLVHRLSNAALVWIGAVSDPANRRPRCHWTDRSPWDFSHWLPGHPLPGRHFCTGLCVNSQCTLEECEMQEAAALHL